MVNQDKLKSKIDTYSLDTLPHSILLLGDEGAGHLDVCEYISNKFDLYNIDISDTISTDYINQVYLTSTPTLYTIDINSLDDKKQNILLKLYEEPGNYIYIVLYGESTYNIIETLVNRSYILKMDLFSRDYLSTLIKSSFTDYILNICTTPGQIETANHTDIEALQKLCENINGRIGSASIGNALTISNKINFSDEYSKYDLGLFIKALGYEFLKSGNIKCYKHLNYVGKNIKFMNDKKKYFDNFILKIYQESRVED